MANYRKRTNRAPIYQLKRLYGGTIVLVKQGTETTDLLTGVKSSSSTSTTIKRAVVIPAKTKRSQTQGASQVDSGKEFMYGAFYDRSTWNFLIDPRDLPAGYEIENDDWVEFDGDRFDIHSISPSKFGSPWTLTAVRADVSDSPVTTTPQYFLYGSSTISLDHSGAIVSNRVKQLTATDIVGLADQALRTGLERILTASSTTAITHTAARTYVATITADDSLVLQGDLGDVVRNTFTTADSPLAVTQQGVRAFDAKRSDAEVLTITQSGSASLTRNITASDALSLSHSGLTSESSALTGSSVVSITQAANADKVAILSASGTLALTDSGDIALVQSLTGSGTLVVTQSADAAKVASLTTSDALALSQSNVVSLGSNFTVTSNLSLSDTAALSVSRARTSADTLTVTDSNVLNKTFGAITASDTLSLTQSGDISLGLSLTGSDALVLTDSGARVYIASTTATDSLSLADTADRNHDRALTGADTLVVTQDNMVDLGFGLSASDTLSVTQTADADKVAARSAADALVVAQSASVSLVQSLTATDALAMTDAASVSLVQSLTASDALALTASANADKVATLTTSATLVLTQSGSIEKVFGLTGSDTLSLIQSATRAHVGGPRTANNALVLQGDVSHRELVGTRSASDSLSLTASGSVQKVGQGGGTLVSGSVIHLDAGDASSYGGTGNTWSDLSGNGNDATIFGTVDWEDINTPGEGSFNLDGTSTFMAIENAPSWADMGTATDFTVEAWVRRDASDTAGNWDLPVIDNFIEADNPRTGFRLGISGSLYGDTGQARAVVGNADQFGVDLGSGVDPSYGDGSNGTDLTYGWKWHHLLMTVDRDGDAIIYVDGVEEARKSMGSTANIDNASGMVLGRRGTTGTFWTGRIGVMRMYHTALTPSEVVQNFDVDKERFDSTYVPYGLLADWNTRTGALAWDIGSSTYQLPNAQDAADTTQRLETSGLGEDALRIDPTTGAKYLTFDGVNDYLTLPGTGNASLLTANYTREIWIRVRSHVTYGLMGAFGSGTDTTGCKITYGMDATGGTQNISGRKNTWNSAEGVHADTAGLDDYWVHVAATFDGADHKLYIDGTLAATTSTGVAVTYNTDIVKFMGNTTGWDWINGDWAACRMYDFALGATSIEQNFLVDKDHYLAPLRENVSLWHDWRTWASGTTIYDQATNQNNGLLIGGATVSEQGYVLDGTSSYTYIPENAQWNTQFDGTGQDYTMEVWGRQTAEYNPGWDLGYMDWLDTGSNPRSGAMLGMGGATYGCNNGARVIYGNASSQYGVDFGPGQDPTYGDGTDAFNLVDSRWHHLVLSADRDGNLELYVDGELVSTASAGTAASQASNARQLYFGRRAGSAHYRTGETGNARMYYGKALTADEVARNFKSEKKLYKVATKVVEYDATNTASYAGAAATTWNDRVGTANITLEGGPVFTSNNSGEVTFDGVNDAAVDDDQLVTTFRDATFSTLSWVRIMGSGHAYGTIMGKTNYVDSDREWIVQHRSADKKIYLWVNDGTSWSSVISATTLSYGQWYQVATTLDGDGNGQIFINGMLDNSATSMGLTMNNTAAEFALGALRSGVSSTSDHLNCELQYAAAFDGVLTALQIQEDFDARRGNYEPDTTNSKAWFDAGRLRSAEGGGVGLSTQVRDLGEAQGLPGSHGTYLDYTGTPTFSTPTADVGGAFWACDGVNDGLKNNTTFGGLSGDFTMKMWLRNHNVSTAAMAVEFDQDSDPALYFNGSGSTLRAYMNDTTAGWEYIQSPANRLESNEWYHYTMTFNSTTNSFSLYINGHLAGTNSVAANNYAMTDLYLMHRGIFGGGSYVNGDLGMFQFQQSTLSDATILEDFNKEKVRYGINDTVAPTLLDLDAAVAPVGTLWADSSANANDCTLFGSPVHTTPDGGQLAWSGANNASYGTVPYSSDFAITDKLTVNMWVKALYHGGLQVMANHTNTWTLEYVASTLAARVAFAGASIASLNYTTAININSILDNTWHMLSFTADGTLGTSSEMHIYLDGILLDSVTNRTGPLEPSIDDITVAAWEPTTGRNWEGSTGRITTYNDVAPTAAIWALYGEQRGRFGV